MVTNNEIKQVRALLQKKYRNQSRHFVVEGEKMIHELVVSDFEIVNVYATQEMVGTVPNVENIEVVTNEQISRMSGLRTPPGILAVVAIPERAAPENFNGWTILLDGLNDPGNLGTILRIADWFGIDRLITSTTSVDVFNPKAVQASMGAIFRVPVYQVETETWLKKMREKEVPVFAADMDGIPVEETDFPGEGVLIMGSESHGIRAEILPYITQRVTISGKGGAESLNVAVAMGIICSRLPIQ